MTASLSKVSYFLTNLLPQSSHVEKIANLAAKDPFAEKSLSKKMDEIFRSKVSEIATRLQKDKQQCIKYLDCMNGSYYQDPHSVLKKSWDKLVKAVQKAIGIQVDREDRLDTLLAQLDIAPNEAKKSARQSIEKYKEIEQKRDDCQSWLNQIFGTEKAALNLEKGVKINLEEQLKAHKGCLKQNYQKLCGNYFGDPNGLLDQAWQKYQAALTQDPTDTSSITDYKNLEVNRKKTEAQLHEIEQLLAIPASNHLYEILKTESTNLGEQLKKEEMEINLKEELKTQKKFLEKKHQKLCGNYFGDPNGLLDRAWKKYQASFIKGLVNKKPLAYYHKLETNRKKIENELFLIKQLNSISEASNPNYEEVLTAESINLEKQLKIEKKRLKQNYRKQSTALNLFDQKCNQAWERYQKTITGGSVEDKSALASYQELNIYREKMKDELYEMEKLLGSPVFCSMQRSLLN
jgi:hypothetical protein